MENKVIIPEGYVPTENEEFMNPVMLEYFRQKLLVMREELSSQLNQIMGNVVDSTIIFNKNAEASQKAASIYYYDNTGIEGGNVVNFKNCNLEFNQTPTASLPVCRGQL